MAVIEQNGLLSYIDAAGNTYILYPVTKLDNVDGAEDLLKIVAQELTEAQKTQARGNIGAAPSSHSHTKSDISDFSHSHTKSDISDFSHSHTKSDISDFPSSMAPTAHKASHAINGADAISPADIGAEASGAAAGLINRTNAVNVANTNYGTVMARGIYAGTTDMTDGVTDLTSGVIYLVYEE